MEPEGSFRDYQTARDAAAVLCGLGILFLAGSLAYLAISLISGFGFWGWLVWYIGPMSLFLGSVMTPCGWLFWRKAERIRPH